jgi:glyoxylase-like metal-dependent hydrolase (beta-lactamase superfamily II)
MAHIFLTHRDDVADADRYARHFGAKRIIHFGDADAVPDAEWILEGTDGVHLADGFQAIPVPGHTAGSMALNYKEKFLFTGDHLWWNPQMQSLEAPRRLVWRGKALKASLERLLDCRFEWVLAGHGSRVKLSAEEMRNRLRAMIDRRERTPVL